MKEYAETETENNNFTGLCSQWLLRRHCVGVKLFQARSKYLENCGN